MKRGFIFPKQLTNQVAKTANRSGIGKFGLFPEHIMHFNPVTYDVKQHLEFSHDISDHLMVQFSTPAFHAASFNTMMQGHVNHTGRANTAFRIHENHEQYTARYMKILEKVRTFLLDNPEISILAFQEAPIREHVDQVVSYINQHFPDEWKIANPDVLHDATNWGLFTLINHKRLQTTKPSLDKSLTQNLSIENMEIRCRTFAMIPNDSSEIIKFTNLHLPHSQAETAFNEFIDNVIEEIIENAINADSFSHHLIGDWNIEAETLNRLVQERFMMKKNKTRAGSVYPCHLTTSLYSSYQGHLKQSGEKLSVDAMLSICVRPANTFNYSFHYYPVTQLMKAGVILLFCNYLANKMDLVQPDFTSPWLHAPQIHK